MIDPHGTRNGSRGRRMAFPAEPGRVFGTDQGPERSATRGRAVHSATDDRYVTVVKCACALPTTARSRGPARDQAITPERMNRTLSDTVTLSPGALRPPAPDRTSPRFDRVSSARRHCHMVNTGRDASISRKSGEFRSEAVYPVDRETPLWHVGRRKWNKQRTGRVGATGFRLQTGRNRPKSLLSRGQPSAGRKKPKSCREEKTTSFQHVTSHKALTFGTQLTRGAMQSRCPHVCAGISGTEGLVRCGAFV